MSRGELAGSLYDLVTGDEDARVCKDIPDAACNDQPQNFFLQLGALVCTKIGDELASAKLVLPWLLSAAGAPAFFIGLLVPIRESLSLLPQLFVAAAIRAQAVRKWFWVGGSVAQALCVMGMAAAALLLEGAAAGWTVVGLLVLFSLARGVSSVAAKDVMGKTVSKTRRGTLTGYATAAAGVVTIAAGAWLQLRAGPEENAGGVAVLLLVAGGLWLLGAALYANLREQPGATEGGGNAGRDALASLSILVTDAPFRRFVITRALLVATALLVPFYAALAREVSGEGLGGLGALLVAAGIASTVSSGFWGRMADRSSRDVLRVAATVAGVLSLAVAGWHMAGAPGLPAGAVVVAAFFIIGVAHAGIRIGRKTYLVDMATAQTRATYVAVSNTAIGVVLLAGGVFGVVAERVGTTETIGLLGLFCLAGAMGATRLDEVTT
ncbi:MAG: MFS transporter [Gammaproteobacteria bacterium]